MTRPLAEQESIISHLIPGFMVMSVMDLIHERRSMNEKAENEVYTDRGEDLTGLIIFNFLLDM